MRCLILFTAILIMLAMPVRADECATYLFAIKAADAIQQERSEHIRKLSSIDPDDTEMVQSFKADLQRLDALGREAKKLEQDTREAVIASFSDTPAAAMLSAMLKVHNDSIQAYIVFEQWTYVAGRDSDVLNKDPGLSAYIRAGELPQASLDVLAAAISLACAYKGEST